MVEAGRKGVRKERQYGARSSRGLEKRENSEFCLVLILIVRHEDKVLLQVVKLHDNTRVYRH